MGLAAGLGLGPVGVLGSSFSSFSCASSLSCIWLLHAFLPPTDVDVIIGIFTVFVAFARVTGFETVLELSPALWPSPSSSSVSQKSVIGAARIGLLGAPGGAFGLVVCCGGVRATF